MSAMHQNQANQARLDAQRRAQARMGNNQVSMYQNQSQYGPYADGYRFGNDYSNDQTGGSDPATVAAQTNNLSNIINNGPAVVG